MFRPVTSLDLPIGDSLLAELGVDRRTVREIAEDDRAMRCPDRGAIYPDNGFASLYAEPPFSHTLHEAAPAEPWDPASSLAAASWRGRRA